MSATKSKTEFVETPKGAFTDMKSDTGDMCNKMWWNNNKMDILIELYQQNLVVNQQNLAASQQLLKLLGEGGSRYPPKELIEDDEIPKAKGNTKEKKSKKEKKPKKAYVPPQDMGAPYNWNIEPFADKNGKTEDKDGNAFGLAVKYSFNKEFKAYIKDIGGIWQIRMKGWQFAEENAQEIVERIQAKFPDWEFEDKRPAAMTEDDEDDEDNDEDNEEDDEDNEEDNDEDNDDNDEDDEDSD